MTSPQASGVTPVYGLRYIVEGQPAKYTRQYLQQNAETIEAALQARGVPAPLAPDLAAVSGRVAVLEPDPWVALALSAGSPYAGWTAPRARLEGDVVRLELYVTGAINAGTVLTTLTSPFRPNGNRLIPGITAPTASCLVQVSANGQVIAGANIAAGGYLLSAGTFPLT